MIVRSLDDLVGTDRTFGFSTAVAIATEALDRLGARAGQVAGGGPSFIERSMARTCLVSAPIET